MVDKRQLTEEDIKHRYITPAIHAAGCRDDLIFMEKYFTAGRITIHGKRTKRGEGRKADYLLCAAPNLPMAIVEAKDNNHPVSAGIQQAIDYAQILEIPFAYSSNGDGFYGHDMIFGLETDPSRPIPLDGFPSPDELTERYIKYRSLSEDAQKALFEPYYFALGTHEPRYYQRIAINTTVEAVAGGLKRALLVMATGTGKTYTAFQIIHRLRHAGLKKRVLYLADRNILIDQTMAQDFKPFSKVMTKVQHKDVNTAYEIYMSLYGQWVEYDHERQSDDSKEVDLTGHRQPYESLAPDFFDLIIVDECHRGSVREDSEWRRILEYFSSATQIGMTATPKQAEGADNLDYFCQETGGVPLYVYSLKQGIEDGFLAPYRVTRSFLDIDLKGWTPEPGEKDLHDYLIEQRQFNRADMGRNLAVQVRRQVVARRITQMLHDVGRMTKTIVFCADQEEALEMRNLLVSLNKDLCQKDSRYVMRITSNDKEGKRQLDNFIDPDEPYPTVVTTSDLLETGVDCKTCGLLVFDKEVSSMSRFKQMVGRGTRIREDKGKFHFDILDFRNVTSKFSDPEFDGVADESGGRGGSGHGADDDGGENGGGETTPKFHIEGPACSIAHEDVRILDADGKLVTISVKDYARRVVTKKYATLDSFLTAWTAADRKQAILDELASADMPLLIETVKEENPSLADKDAFDIILHLAYDQKPLTRRERVNNVKKRNYLAKYEGKAREVLEALLEKYAERGVSELESEDVLELQPFSEIGTAAKITRFFGGFEQFETALRELEAELYRKAG